MIFLRIHLPNFMQSGSPVCGSVLKKPSATGLFVLICVIVLICSYKYYSDYPMMLQICLLKRYLLLMFVVVEVSFS